MDEGVEGHQVPEADGGQADEAEVERGPERPALGAGEESGPQEEDEDDEDDADHDGNVDLFEQGKGGSEVSLNDSRSRGCGFKPRCHQFLPHDLVWYQYKLFTHSVQVKRRCFVTNCSTVLHQLLGKVLHLRKDLLNNAQWKRLQKEFSIWQDSNP